MREITRNHFAAFARGAAAAAAVCALAGASLLAADSAVKALEGTVKSVDSKAHTVTIRAEDGTDHVFHLVKRTTLHDAKVTDRGADAAGRDLQQDSHVVVHYTERGTRDTAEEIDRTGEGGLKSSEGVITRFDRSAKTMTVKAEDGTEQTYRMSGHAAEDAGRETGDATKKSAHVVVYYTEEAGHKVAHFFEMK